MTHEHSTEVERLTQLNNHAAKEMSAMVPAPLQIKKQWVRNVGSKGGRMEWMPHVDKCIMEMLPNRTQPSNMG